MKPFRRSRFSNVSVHRQFEQNPRISSLREEVSVRNQNEQSSFERIITALSEEEKKRRHVPVGAKLIGRETSAFENFLDKTKEPKSKRKVRFQQESEDVDGEKVDAYRRMTRVSPGSRATDLVCAQPIETKPVEPSYHEAIRTALSDLTTEVEIENTLDLLKRDYFSQVQTKLRQIEEDINSKNLKGLNYVRTVRNEKDWQEGFEEVEQNTKKAHKQLDDVRKTVKKIIKVKENAIQERAEREHRYSTGLRTPKPAMSQSKIPKITTIKTPKKTISTVSQPKLSQRDRSIIAEKSQKIQDNYEKGVAHAKANIHDEDILQEQMTHLQNEKLNKLAQLQSLPETPARSSIGGRKAFGSAIPVGSRRRIPEHNLRSEQIKKKKFLSRTDLAKKNLREILAKEENKLRQTVDDPEVLKEELEFLREEFEAKIATIDNIESLKRYATEQYKKKLNETQAEGCLNADMKEFLEEEHKGNLVSIEEDVGLHKISSPTPSSQPSCVDVQTSAKKMIYSKLKSPSIVKSAVEKPKGVWKTPSKGTMALKKKVEKDLESLRKEAKSNKEILETVEKAVPLKTVISSESIKPLTTRFGINKNEKIDKMLDSARKRTFQLKKKAQRLPPTVAENLTKRGNEQLEIDPLEKEAADAIVHTMILEQSGISMKGDPKDITNLLVPSDSPKVKILGNAIESKNHGVIPRNIPTRQINTINPLKSDEISLTLKTHSLKIPPENVIAKEIPEGNPIPVKEAPLQFDKADNFINCDILLNSFNVENLFQARGILLPKWWPGFFSAFPGEPPNLLPYKSPSEILNKAWEKVKPEYIQEAL